MPRYLYECPTCGHKIEAQRSVETRNDGPTCLLCPRALGTIPNKMKIIPALSAPHFPGADRWR